MNDRPRYRSSVAPHSDVRITTPDRKLCVSLRRVHAGVVVGRIQSTGVNAHSDCWAIVDHPGHLKACIDLDALRFAYPSTFAQIEKEFQVVYDQPAPVDPIEGHRTEAGLFD